MNGYTLSMISEKTGININKLKAIVARDKTVRELPYSVKNGGNRIFFDDFVTWLKHYEGIDVAELHKLQSSNHSNSGQKPSLPNGTQMVAITRLFDHGALSKDQVSLVLGLPVATQPDVIPAPVRAQLPAPHYVSHAEAERTLRPLITGLCPKAKEIGVKAALGAQRRQEARDAQWNKNGKLFREGL